MGNLKSLKTAQQLKSSPNNWGGEELFLPLSKLPKTEGLKRDALIPVVNGGITEVTTADDISKMAKGEKGEKGDSAFQVWLEDGNTGTLSDYLFSLKGLPGKDGDDGLSVYDIWLLVGNTGTEADFLASLKGAKGDNAYQVWLAAGNVGTEQDFLFAIAGSSVNVLYPVGIVTWFALCKDPNKLFPGTEWQCLGENLTVRLGKADGSDVMTTGGSDSITLTEDNIPKHGHKFKAKTNEVEFEDVDTEAGGEHDHSYETQRYRGGDGNSSVTDRFYWSSGISSGKKTFRVEAVDGHVHKLKIPKHGHEISGETEAAGGSSKVNIVNSYIKLIGWFRIK